MTHNKRMQPDQIAGYAVNLAAERSVMWLDKFDRYAYRFTIFRSIMILL